MSDTPRTDAVYAEATKLGPGGWAIVKPGSGLCDPWELARQLERELAEAKAAKDGAYFERNQVVSALSKCFLAGIARTAIEGWSEDWHGCVYIDLPTGQVSWHFHDSQAYLFAHLPLYRGKWDGHDTPEKYRRLAALAGKC